jgi:spermidine/putrescine transport system substrate-binding protein
MDRPAHHPQVEEREDGGMGQFDAVMGNPASRRTFLKGVGVLGGSAVLAACRKSVDESGGGGGATASSSIGPIEDEPGLLKAYEWAGYDTKWLYADYLDAGYEEPKFSFFVNTEGALAKTQAGYEWDVTHPESGYVQDYVNMNAIQPWDTSLIPNFADLNPALEASGQVDGKQYEIGLDWGYSAPLIRTDKLDPNMDSYSYLFTDDAQGHISWFDTPWILQMAAISQGMDPSHSFDMDQGELDDITSYVTDVGKRNLYNIWVNYQDMWDDVQTGNVWSTYAWPDAYVALKDRVPVAYIRPSNGTLAWVEGLVLRADTQNYHHAHAFADAWAAASVGTKLISTWGYGHSNLDIDLTKIDPDVVKVFGLDDPEKNLSEPLSYLDRYQPNRNAYNRAWNEVKASLG